MKEDINLSWEKIHTIIFDFDGVLADDESEKVWAGPVKLDRLLRRNKIKATDEKET